MNTQQKQVLEALRLAAKASGFDIVGFLPGQTFTLNVDPSLLTSMSESTLVDSGIPVDYTQVHIDTSKLPPKLAKLVEDDGTTAKLCPACGMPMVGSTCFECQITPAG